MSSTMAAVPSVSAIKSMLKIIIKNLETLENSSSQIAEINTNDLQKETERLLGCLENLPLKSIARKVSNNRKRRKNKLLQQKKLKKENQQNYLQTLDTSHTVTKTSITTTSNSRKVTGDSIQMRLLQEGEKFLKIFDKLEELHLNRGQNAAETKRFAKKLLPLRSTWNTIMEENQLHQNPHEEFIHQEWNTALFGSANALSIQRHCDVNDFIRKREIWDSYITKKHKGSRIPLGYVLPPAKAADNWSKYLLCNSKIDD